MSELLLSWTLTIFSWVGAIALLFRAFPQACKSWADGHSEGLAPSMLWMWLFGSVCIIPHLMYNHDWATLTIYISNLFTVCVMIWYFYFPRETTQNKGD